MAFKPGMHRQSYQLTITEEMNSRPEKLNILRISTTKNANVIFLIYKKNVIPNLKPINILCRKPEVYHLQNGKSRFQFEPLLISPGSSRRFAGFSSENVNKYNWEKGKGKVS